MENGEIKELKRELIKNTDVLERELKAFKRRVSTIANLFIPGIGFFLYGSSYLKGILSFVLFASYNLLYFTKILHSTDTGVAVIYYIPAIIVWAVSTLMVISLDD